MYSKPLELPLKQLVKLQTCLVSRHLKSKLKPDNLILTALERRPWLHLPTLTTSM